LFFEGTGPSPQLSRVARAEGFLETLQCLDARHAALRAVQAEGPRVPKLIAHKSLGLGYGFPQSICLRPKRHRDDGLRIVIELPQPCQPAAVEDRVVRQIRE